MLTLRTFLFLFMVFKASNCLEEPKICHACIDTNYLKFFRNNNLVFHEEYRNYAIRHGFQDHKCTSLPYKQVKCMHSCLRVHLKSMENNKTNTIGWLFDCSTNIVRKVPDSIPGIPSNLRNFTGDLQFIDRLNDRGQLLVSFEFQFYSTSADVETGPQYYERLVNERKVKSEKEACEKNLILCAIKKAANSTEFKYGILLLVILFFVGLALKWCCCPAKSTIYSPARVSFVSLENAEDGRIEIIDE